MRKPYLNQNIAQSYIDQNSVRISGLEGELKNYEGKEFNDVFFLVVDEDKCKNYIVNPGEQIPGDFENMGIILLAKETDGIYQIASSHTGSYRGSNGGDGREGACPGQPAPNININVNTNVTCPTIPAPTQTQGPASEPAPQPTTLGEYIAPRLTDNSWNEIGFKTSIPYEEIYLAFCENGTDGRGNVINSCNKFTKAFPPAIFRYIKTDENDPKTHIYRGYIPNIPGTEEATYKMIGYMLNNIQYWENSTQTGAVQNIQHSTQPKKKKRNIIKRIFGKKN